VGCRRTAYMPAPIYHRKVFSVMHVTPKLHCVDYT